MQDVIDAGALKADEICKGIESDCEALGMPILPDTGTVAGPPAPPPSRDRLFTNRWADLRD